MLRLCYARKNRYFRRSHLWEAKFRALIRYFAHDLRAWKIAELSGVSRPTINQLFMKLRIRIAQVCNAPSHLSGEFKVDKSYFGVRRVRGKSRGARSGKPIVFGILERHGKLACDTPPSDSAPNDLYHTKTLQNEIERDNWDLSKLPIDANEVMVDGSNDGAWVAETVRREDGTVPSFDDLHDVSAPSMVNLERVRDLDLHVDLSDLGLARYKPLVEEIQRRLIDMGFLDPPPVDGSFGLFSTLALETLREYGLHSDDEVIDGKLAWMLFDTDSDRFVPVPVYPDNDLASRIYKYMMD